MGISGESKIIPNKAKTKEKKSEYYFPLRKQTEVGKKINAGNAYTVSLRTRNTE